MKITVKGTTEVLDVKFDAGKAIISGELGGRCTPKIFTGIGRPDEVHIFETYIDPYGGGGWDKVAEITPAGVLYLGNLLEFDTEGLSVGRSLDGGFPIYEFHKWERDWNGDYKKIENDRYENDADAIAAAEKWNLIYHAVVAPDGRCIWGKVV